MAKKQPNFSSIQADIFQQLESPSVDRSFSDLDMQFEIRGAMHHSLKAYKSKGGSRERLVDDMNALMPDLAKKITKRQIDAWLATSAEDKEFPLRYIAAFCVATKSDLPLRIIVNSIGLDLADQRDLIAAELGHTEIQRAQMSRKIASLKNLLGDDQ